MKKFKKKILKMLEIASLTVSISKLRHYTNFSDRPPLSQYPGSAPGHRLRQRLWWWQHLNLGSQNAKLDRRFFFSRNLTLFDLWPDDALINLCIEAQIQQVSLQWSINAVNVRCYLITIYNNNALMKTPDRTNWVQSIEPKFQPVRPGKVVHLKWWTRFFETFPVGLNRSIEF